MKTPNVTVTDQGSVLLQAMHEVEMGWEAIISLFNIIICFGRKKKKQGMCIVFGERRGKEKQGS